MSKTPKRFVIFDVLSEGEKLAHHVGLEPTATVFREPRSAVELMVRDGSDTYVGVPRIISTVFVIMSISILVPM